MKLMSARPPGLRSARALLLAFGAVSVAFVVSTAVAEYVDVAILHGAKEITRKSAPAIARLATLRGELHTYVLLADDATDRGVDGLPQPRDPGLDSAEGAIQRTWAEYGALGSPAGESLAAIQAAKGEVAAAMTRLDGDMTRSEWTVARGTLAKTLRPAARRFDDLLMGLIERHSDRGAEVARKIERLGKHSISLAIGLDTVSVVLAFCTALLMVRVVRRYAALVEQRAEELELFAGRVAHDVLGPLGAASLALDAAAREAPAGSVLARMVVRGQSGLRRTRTIADALLAFARAGARPQAGERADVAEVVRGIADEVEVDARARGIALQVELSSPGAVVCSAGMLASIVSNLVRNAIKYVGEGPDRRVVVRAGRADGVVRIEVEDNGPGLPAGLGKRSFEPYVRGPGSREPGIGLGLATVKKVTEAHGGKVDVHSVLGRGTRFGVDLPAAPGVPEPRAPLPPSADGGVAFRRADT